MEEGKRYHIMALDPEGNIILQGENYNEEVHLFINDIPLCEIYLVYLHEFTEKFENLIYEYSL